MPLGALLESMAAAICKGDAEAAAACFTPRGVYHDGFYGEFAGRAEIARMVRDFFHRDARDFAWRMMVRYFISAEGLGRRAKRPS